MKAELLFLREPFRSLNFSSDFLKASQLMGYNTVADVLSDSTEVLQQKEGFSYHWLSELSRFLLKYDALDLLQEMKK